MANTTSKRAPKSITPANPWVKGLYPGTHTAMSGVQVTFSPADITSHVNAVKAQLSPGMARPPLVKGHPKHDDPRVGSVVDVELRDDGAAWYKVDELAPAFAESCWQGEYVYSSPKLNKDGSLRHLGALGAWNPSLKDQPGFAFGEAPEAMADDADGTLAFGVSTDWGSVTGGWLNRIAWRLRSVGSILRRQREATIEKDGIEAADKLYPTYEIENLEGIEIPYDITPATSGLSPAFGEPAPAPAAPTPAVPAAPVAPADGAGDPAPAPAAAFAPAEQGHSRPLQKPDAQAPADVEVARLRAELDEANRKLADQAAEASAKAFGEKLEQTVSEGRLSPVLAQKFQTLFATLSSSDQLAFGEGDPVRTELEAILDALPTLVAFGELPDPRPVHHSPINPIIANAEARAEAAAKEHR